MLTHRKGRKLLKNLGDVLMVIFSFLAAAFLARRHAGAAMTFLDPPGLEYFLLLFFCLAWNYGARSFALYDELHNRSFRSEVVGLGENIILQTLLAVAVLFLVKSQVYSRFFLFVYYVLLLASLLAWRALLGLTMRRRQKKVKA